MTSVYMGPKGALFYIRILKSIAIVIKKNSLKIVSWVYFGCVLGVAASKKYIGASILTIFQIFKNKNFQENSFTLLFYFWVRFRRLGALPSNAQWRNTHGVFFSDFLVGWEARTAQNNVLNRLQPSKVLVIHHK